MRKRFKTFFILALATVLAASCGCSNIFTGMSNKETDDAYYEEALKASSRYDWDAAIGYFQALSSDYLARTYVREGYAGALAGKCGLDFLAYMNSLGSSDPSTSTLFLWLMNAFNQKAVNPSYCTLAETQINAIGSTSLQRTHSQNLFMLILSMAKIGTYLRNKADIDGDNDLGDGDVDGDFEVCEATSFSDAEVTEVVTGFSIMLANFDAFSSVLGGSTSGVLASVATACGALTPNPCVKTDPAQVDADDIKNMRNLLATSSANPSAPVGVGICNDPMVISCCP